MGSLLEAKGICKYFGGLKAVEDVSMHINKGDVFGIIGPNGAGKTTFFNICSGIYTPTKGEILLNGDKISHLKSEQIAQRGMARTFQNIQLFKYMTVLENVKIGFHIHTKTKLWDSVLHTKTFKEDEEFTVQKGLEIIDKVGLSKYTDTMAGNLAYGIQRKVEIARALALDPQILLLDEPAAGMNPQETQELMEFIKILNADGYTIAVIEHDMKFVMNSCNRILVLNFGQKICEGTPDDVKSNQQVQEAYFGKGIIAGEAVK
ncbi:ABC transporter ATP-binding protein [Anaerocolumna aminovalerica]|uniref:Amino acid/amide ABC transporter ATP-binding protein 1, HAAT family n=1 Tax=Anaerocolumna aminovalerica TaxID=1527 RepID=A0A1I5C373_9FIRM|nr:ABC transporter ATP-binding protein [Anaerocolumna aminovalerica]SFN81473.1 amino acid/amide ABC transporter ATP-binding protein 1, HAAT family [Anaerocolumna aminovalerica]